MAALGSKIDRTEPTISNVSEDARAVGDRKTSKEHSSDSYFVEHLNGLFPPLQFPPELARRVLTHGSHPSAASGHNAGLRFIG